MAVNQYKVHSWHVYAKAMMIKVGIDVLIVCCIIIGHKDPNDVSLRIYFHPSGGHKKALDRIL